MNNSVINDPSGARLVLADWLNFGFVRVRGLVTSEGWEEVALLPMTRGTPADGILDLALVAQSPDDTAKPGEYADVEAIFAIEPGHPFKGVRVHSAANRVIVQGLPGYSAAAAPPKNCADCIAANNALSLPTLPGRLCFLKVTTTIPLSHSRPPVPFNLCIATRPTRVLARMVYQRP